MWFPCSILARSGWSRAHAYNVMVIRYKFIYSSSSCLQIRGRVAENIWAVQQHVPAVNVDIESAVVGACWAVAREKAPGCGFFAGLGCVLPLRGFCVPSWLGSIVWCPVSTRSFITPHLSRQHAVVNVIKCFSTLSHSKINQSKSLGAY